MTKAIERLIKKIEDKLYEEYECSESPALAEAIQDILTLKEELTKDSQKTQDFRGLTSPFLFRNGNNAYNERKE